MGSHKNHEVKKSEMRMVCVTHGQKMNICRILVGNPEEKYH